MKNSIIIRSFNISDVQAIVALFRNAVHAINVRDYSLEQVNAWAPSDIDMDRWATSLSKNITFVAEIDSTIIGFADMSYQGHLDRLYVHPKYQAQGVAYRLFKKIEESARNLGLSRITTDCSITAKKPAERMGFVVIQKQTVLRNGIELTNYAMEKKLA